mmetsp:Transcript_58844/g.140330  ORF Transcript_58844/g.140330 Transcript_58844/m.140330 type:complete len:186 (-) Transcript_58844:188-745(-)
MGVNVDIDWEPFFLNERLPPGGEDIKAHLDRKYGPGTSKKMGRLDEAGEKVGIKFNMDRKIYETMEAHRVVEWVKQTAPEKHDKLMEVIFRNYFTDAADITSHDVLLSIVDEVGGLDRSACQQMLAGSEFKSEVPKKVNLWRNKGVHGVPLFLFDVPGRQDPVALEGAHPPESMMKALKLAQGKS